MNILESICSTAGGGVVQQVAEQFGIDPKKAASTVSTLLPALASGMKEKLASGDTTIPNLINSGNLQQYCDNPSTLSSQEAVDQGNTLLTAIFGRGDLSNMISMVAEKVDINSSVISRMLPIVATLFGALLAKGSAGGGSLADTVGQIAHAGQGGLAGAVRSLTSKVFG
jgi:hypothetical protein